MRTLTKIGVYFVIISLMILSIIKGSSISAETFHVLLIASIIISFIGITFIFIDKLYLKLKKQN